jgi:hypothetical protein
LSEDLRESHTEVDEKGLLWAQRLAEQEKQMATNSDASLIQAELTYFAFKDNQCERQNIQGYKCGGRTILRSLPVERRKGTTNRIFIGCELYQRREKHHMFFPIPSNIDVPSLIRIFGPRRAFIHQDILDSISFSWEEDEKISKSHFIYSSHFY